MERQVLLTIKGLQIEGWSGDAWHPIVKDSMVEKGWSSDRIGCVRRFHLQDGSELRELLLTGGHATEDDLKAIDREIKATVNASADFARESPEPDVAELWTDIYA